MFECVTINGRFQECFEAEAAGRLGPPESLHNHSKVESRRSRVVGELSHLLNNDGDGGVNALFGTSILKWSKVSFKYWLACLLE